MNILYPKSPHSKHLMLPVLMYSMYTLKETSSVGSFRNMSTLHLKEATCFSAGFLQFSGNTLTLFPLFPEARKFPLDSSIRDKRGDV